MIQEWSGSVPSGRWRLNHRLPENQDNIIHVVPLRFRDFSSQLAMVKFDSTCVELRKHPGLNVVRREERLSGQIAFKLSGPISQPHPYLVSA